MAISRAWNEEILLCFHHFRQNVIYGASTRTCLSCHIYPLNNDAFTQVRTYNDRIVHALSLFLAKVKIVEHPDVIHREYGAAVDLQCTATGDPPPLISWMKGGRPVSTFQNCHFRNICINQIYYILWFRSMTNSTNLNPKAAHLPLEIGGEIAEFNCTACIL